MCIYPLATDRDPEVAQQWTSGHQLASTARSKKGPRHSTPVPAAPTRGRMKGELSGRQSQQNEALNVNYRIILTTDQ